MASFIFFDDYAEALSELSDKSRLKVYDALCDYAFKNIEPDLKGESKAVFALIKREIDGYNKRVENGKKGGRKKSVVEPQLNHTSTTLSENKNHTSTTLDFEKESPLKEVPLKDKESNKEKENIYPQESYPQENHSLTAGARVRIEGTACMTCAEFLTKYPNITPDANIAAYGLDWDLLDEKFQNSTKYLQGEPHDLSWVKNNYRRIIGDVYRDKQENANGMGYNGMAFFDEITANLKAREAKANDG